MAEQAVWHLKRATLAIPLPSVAAIRKRAWMVGPPLLLGLLGALLATLLQAPAWRSEAQVSLAYPPPAWQYLAALFSGDREQFMKGQAKLARSPELAQRVVALAGVPGETASKFLSHASASPDPDTNILKLSVTSSSSADLARLVNTYAEEFTKYKAELYRKPIEQALRKIQARLDLPRARGLTWPVYQALLQLRTKLQNYSRQLAGSATVMRRATGASSFRPHVLRNGILGGTLGVLLGVALTVGVAARRRRAD